MVIGLSLRLTAIAYASRGVLGQWLNSRTYDRSRGLTIVVGESELSRFGLF